MARKIFLRGKWRTYSKLGKRRKNKQKYRKATGIHNKIRLEMKGNPIRVKIGYKKAKKDKRKEIKIIKNIKDLDKAERGEKIILARVGKKKKIEIAKKARERGIVIENLNTSRFFKKIEKEGKKAKAGKKVEKQNKEVVEEKTSESKRTGERNWRTEQANEGAREKSEEEENKAEEKK